jgi:hypothetical protein
MGTLINEVTKEPEPGAMHYQRLPNEEISLTAPLGQIYKKTGEHHMNMAELKQYLARETTEASEKGQLHQTLKHYASELSGIMDEPTLDKFRTLAQASFDNRHDPQKLEITRKQLGELIGSIRIVKNPKGR